MFDRPRIALGDRHLTARTVASAAAVTTVGVLPVYLVGAVAVQIRADFPFDQAALGAAVAAYFAASAISSTPLGRFVERLGPVRGMRTAAATSSLALLAIGIGARATWHVAAFLVLAGLANAGGQPAANLGLARGVREERHGLVFGIKQAAIPASTLLAGLAVPTLAIVFGWRWAFVAGALAATVAAASVPNRALERPADERPAARSMPTAGVEGRPTLDISVTELVIFAAAGCLGSAVVNAMGVFLVDAAVTEGFREASAGRLLAVSSVAGLSTRVVAGWFADRGGISGFAGVAGLMGIGAGGLLLMGLTGGQLLVFSIGAVVGVGAGWGWPGLYYYSIVATNRRAPAAATGAAQSGVYLGGMLGPLAFGFVAEHASYDTAWLGATAGLLLAAAAVLAGWRLLARRVSAFHG